MKNLIYKKIIFNKSQNTLSLFYKIEENGEIKYIFGKVSTKYI